jgi:hypothetical protein
MVKKENNYQNILHDFFYPEYDIQNQVLAMTQKSLIDSLAIRESW